MSIVIDDEELLVLIDFQETEARYAAESLEDEEAERRRARAKELRELLRVAEGR